MILLGQNKYWKVVDPLNRLNINTLFARAVVNGQVSGSIYIDNPENPKIFAIFHPYGMSLLFGDSSNKIFIGHVFDFLLKRNRLNNKSEWLQVFPDQWNSTVERYFEENYPEKVEKYGRANFRFNKEKYLTFRKTLKPEDYTIIRTDKNVFEKMNGTVIPKYFWDNADDFIKNGIGFTLQQNGEMASTAFLAYRHENLFELGIETAKEFWGKGFAVLTCAAMIDYAIDNGFEPVWSCRKENTGSFLLAQKLGFEHILTIPFYKIML